MPHTTDVDTLRAASAKSDAPPVPYLFSIAEAVTATGGAISRTHMFDLINRGEIDAPRIGRRTVIVAAGVLVDGLRWKRKRRP